jgi:PAS domain S-box-containing protein
MASKNYLSSFSVNLWMTIFGFVVCAISFSYYVYWEKQIDRANELRHQSFLLANELHQSSDDLTRMVRAYVATGNPIYKQRYQEILDIRDGKKPRPVESYNIHGNLVLTDDQRPRPDSGQAIPLLQLMRQSGFAEEEFAKLAQAKANSDVLTSTELAAMKLMESTNPTTEANRTKAIQMLYETRYHQAEAEIMRPISEFNRMMDERTLHVVQFAEQVALMLRFVFIAFSLLLIFLLWRSYKSLELILGGSADEIYAQIKRIGSGNLTSSITVAKGMQNSVIGWLSETQANLASIDAKHKQAETRIHHLIKLYKALSEINQAIVRMEQQVELFPLVCKCAVDYGGMMMAWVGQRNEVSGLITPVASYGKGLDYLNGIVVSSRSDVPEGCGPTGTALRENRSFIINDYFASSMTAPWKVQATSYGWGSAAAFPIPRGDQPFAVLTVYYAQINAFDEEAIALMGEMSRDISFALDNFDRGVKQKAIEESLRLTASVYENSSEAMLITDADNLIVAINPAFSAITGFSFEEVKGKDPKIFKSGRHDQAFYQALWQALKSNGQWRGEIWDKNKNGDIHAKLLTINIIRNEDGSVHRYVALFSDITEKKQSEELIWKQANFDTLTGLPNRDMFHDRLEQEVLKSDRAELPLALLLIDLDQFKEVNDTLGHAVGDTLLQAAAGRLRACVRESDTVARLGGG